jgi:acyl-CoA thioester hydrolase
MRQVPLDPQSFRWQVRVYYEDTDAGGVVYYANYLRFMERARSEWLRGLGWDQSRLGRDHGIVFAVRRADLRFLRPARLDDLLIVTAGIDKTSRTSIDFSQQVARAQDDVVCCSGTVNVACIGAESMRPTRIPDVLLRAMANSYRALPASTDAPYR